MSLKWRVLSECRAFLPTQKAPRCLLLPPVSTLCRQLAYQYLTFSLSVLKLYIHYIVWHVGLLPSQNLLISKIPIYYYVSASYLCHVGIYLVYLVFLMHICPVLSVRCIC